MSQHAAGLAARFSVGRIAADRQQTNQSGAAQHAVIQTGRDADSGEQRRLKEFRHRNKGQGIRAIRSPDNTLPTARRTVNSLRTVWDQFAD